ncbi:MAG: glycosyltransferase family 4 protein [Victivallales bacterium]|nr:glycosyltransferase family 4 protein [Victivallales bacterium]
MRITWVTRSFLDYRIPVYAELDRLCGNQLTLIYNGEVVPERCQIKIQNILGNRAVAMDGEKRLTGQKSAPISNVQRKGIRIPWQPGLIRACRKSMPDVCVSDGFFQWTYAPLWMRLRYHIPHVMCYEPTKYTERNAQCFRTWYRRFACHWIDEICCNGTLCKEYCQDILHIANEKLHTGNMTADSEQLATACQVITGQEITDFKKTLNLTGTIFLFVGRLVELKGLKQLLMAWKEASLTNATFLCVGEGPQSAELEGFCRTHKISAAFVGAIDYDHLPIYYKSSDVFIIPTLQDNWSLVVPEAMACGLPIACSQYNGCWPELVTSENGWVFDPLNLNDTVQMLQNIHKKPKQELQQMGKCSEQIVSRHTPATAAASIFQACEQAISAL